jgi:hypothetical protein
MLLTKVKAAALVLAVVGLALSGGLLTHRQLAAQRAEAGKGVEGKAGAAKPPKPAELKVLDRVEGKWRFEWESKPTAGNPKGSKGSGTSINEWILDGWFQQHKGKVGDRGPELLEIWTYDQPTKTYRAWGFIGPGGGRYEGTATWDEKASTLNYKGKGPGDVTYVSTWRFIDKDHRESTRVARDAAGKVVEDTLIKLTRQK